MKWFDKKKLKVAETVLRWVAVIVMLIVMTFLMPMFYTVFKNTHYGLFRVETSEGEGRGFIRIYDPTTGTIYWYNRKGKCEASFKVSHLGDALTVKEY